MLNTIRGTLIVVLLSLSHLSAENKKETAETIAWPADIPKPQVLLCADSSQIPADEDMPDAKLVYGYIDSIKTPCMSETEFLQMYLETVAYQKRDSVDAANTIKNDSTQQKVLDAIARGEKNFMKADLSELDLMGAVITGANFKDANLQGVDLRDANLRGCDFRGANLKNAYLKGSNLSGCRFEKATLDSASFLKCNLTKAKGLTAENTLTAKTFVNAKLDKKVLNYLLDEKPELLGVPTHCRENGKWKNGEGCEETRKNLSANK